MTAGPVFVSSAAVARVLSWREAIDAVADAYRRPLGEAAVPDRAVAGRHPA